jgi:hypothetical protein
MRSELFQPTVAGEARLLILIDAFSGGARALEGRTKLAKLDFLLRYPAYFNRALQIRVPGRSLTAPLDDGDTIENRMVRYRYGPWDPAYYALLGRLIGLGLVQPVPVRHGIGYKTTDRGSEIAGRLAATEAWKPIAVSVALLRRHFDLAGTTLKQFIYDHFPEVTQASWGDRL